MVLGCEFAALVFENENVKLGAAADKDAGPD
jgi:hypothetical protein